MPNYKDHPRNIKQRRAEKRRKAQDLVEELRDELALQVRPDGPRADLQFELIRRANEFLGEDRNARIQ